MIIAKIETFPLRIPFKPGTRAAASAWGQPDGRRLFAVSREVSPTDSAVVTIGLLQAGTKENIIPSEALIKLNVRTSGVREGKERGKTQLASNQP